MSDDFQAEHRFFGMMSSPAFVRAPEGNGVGEQFIRTLKEQLLWITTFRTVEDLCDTLQTWLVERQGFRSPAQVRREILASQEAARECSFSSQSGHRWSVATNPTYTVGPEATLAERRDPQVGSNRTTTVSKKLEVVHPHSLPSLNISKSECSCCALPSSPQENTKAINRSTCVGIILHLFTPQTTSARTLKT